MDLENHDSLVGLETDVKAAFSSSVLSKFVFCEVKCDTPVKKNQNPTLSPGSGKGYRLFLVGLPMFQRARERSSIPSFSLTTTQLTNVRRWCKDVGEGLREPFRPSN